MSSLHFKKYTLDRSENFDEFLKAVGETMT